MALEKEEFFAVLERNGQGITFDDVSIEPGPSDYDVNDVDISTQITPDIRLKAPIVSAAMDTVTNSDVAIEMAKMGGLGVIHCSQSIEEQRKEVRRVKHHLNGLIERPVTVNSEQTIEDVLSLRMDRDFRFSTFPVVNEGGVLVGLLSSDDIESHRTESSTRVEAAMRSMGEFALGKVGTTVDEAATILRDEHEDKLPLVNEEGQLVGLYTLTDITRILSGDNAGYSVDGNRRLLVAAALPTRPDEALARIDALGQYCDLYFLDTAQGDSRKYAYLTVKTVKEERGVPLVAGNVSVDLSTRELIRQGADGIKTGQGDGRTCITRLETGIGVPQISAVWNTSRAAKEFGVPVCSDGGISSRGNIAKAIVAGADYVMIGTMIGATLEAPGNIETDSAGRKSKTIRGMGSASALRENPNSRGYDPTGRLPEGVETVVPIAGTVEEVVGRAIQALKRSMELSGRGDIEDMKENSRFILNTNAGSAEARPQILDEYR